MAINFDQFKNTSDKQKSPKGLYRDLHLDIEQQTIHHPGLKEATLGKDIRLDYDIAAVLNSLNNIFNTVPGQRFLIPTFGLNLMAYLFTPVSVKYGDLIGADILEVVARWEPRVKVTKLLINANPEEHEYDIALALYLPDFKYYTGVISKLTQNGFAPLKENF